MFKDQRVKITKLVMAFAQLSPAYKQTVGTRLKGFNDKEGVHSTGTHDADHADV